MSYLIRQYIRIAGLVAPAASQRFQIAQASSSQPRAHAQKCSIPSWQEAKPILGRTNVALHQLAWGRSGCKGRYAKVSIVANRAEYLPFILATLTPDSVRQALAPSMLCQIERIDLPDLHGLQLKLQLVELASSWNEREAKALARLVLELTVPFPTRLVRRAYL